MFDSLKNFTPCDDCGVLVLTSQMYVVKDNWGGK